MATKNTRQPTGHIAPFGLRLQPELKAELEAKAEHAGRSLNAEIAERLANSLSSDPARALKTIEIQTRLIETLAGHLKTAARLAKSAHPERKEQLDFLETLGEALMVGDIASAAVFAKEVADLALRTEGVKSGKQG